MHTTAETVLVGWWFGCFNLTILIIVKRVYSIKSYKKRHLNSINYRKLVSTLHSIFSHKFVNQQKWSGFSCPAIVKVFQNILSLICIPFQLFIRTICLFRRCWALEPFKNALNYDARLLSSEIEKFAKTQNCYNNSSKNYSTIHLFNIQGDSW